MSTTFHLAIIPDGNRRWAKKHGLKGYRELYQRGVDGLLDIAEAAFDAGVTHLSLWASSHANMTNRSSDFAVNIDRVFRDNIARFANHPVIEKYDVKIDVIGEWRDSLRAETIAVIEDAMAKTAHRMNRRLTLLIDYSGTRERDAAVQSLVDSPPASDEPASQSLRARTWTGHLPDLDLIVRTGSWEDPHNSAGFMSLLADETQFSYPELLWPEFSGEQLNAVIDDFHARERRMGK